MFFDFRNKPLFYFLSLLFIFTPILSCREAISDEVLQIEEEAELIAIEQHEETLEVRVLARSKTPAPLWSYSTTYTGDGKGFYLVITATEDTLELAAKTLEKNKETLLIQSLKPKIRESLSASALSLGKNEWAVDGTYLGDFAGTLSKSLQSADALFQEEYWEFLQETGAQKTQNRYRYLNLYRIDKALLFRNYLENADKLIKGYSGEKKAVSLAILSNLALSD